MQEIDVSNLRLCIFSALEIVFKLYFVQPIFSGPPVLTSHLAIPRRGPFNTGSTVVRGFSF